MIDKEERIAYFKNDIFATETVGITVEELTEEKAVCRLILTPAHRNAEGCVMGGVTFTLGDFTFALFANRHETATVSLGANISYLGVAKGKELIATATPIKEGRSVLTCEIMIRDELGNAVAHMTVNGFRKR